MGDDFTLSEFMKILFGNRFTRFMFLSSEEFLVQLKKRKMHKKQSDLKFYGKTKIVNPYYMSTVFMIRNLENT